MTWVNKPEATSWKNREIQSIANQMPKKKNQLKKSKINLKNPVSMTFLHHQMQHWTLHHCNWCMELSHPQLTQHPWELEAFYINFKGCNSTRQVLDLFSKNYQFESHKPQDHWRLIWSLISWPVRLVRVHTSWLGHPH